MQGHIPCLNTCNNQILLTLITTFHLLPFLPLLNHALSYHILLLNFIMNPTSHANKIAIIIMLITS